jgi:hypothetical protein
MMQNSRISLVRNIHDPIQEWDLAHQVPPHLLGNGEYPH